MPVTITLTDEQALDIVSQVSGMLKQRGHQQGGGFHLDETKLKPQARIIKKVDTMEKGQVFSTQILGHEFGVDSSTVSSVLAKLRKVGVVEMLQRGTWKKKN
jgi:hypothetical protein